MENMCERKYTFQFALTNKTQQQQILELARPFESLCDVNGLEPAYGVTETRGQLFLMCIRQCTQKDREYDQTLYTTYFAVLWTDKILSASYTATNEWAEGQLFYDVPKEQEELIRQALDFWRNQSERIQFEAKLKETGISLPKLTAELRKPALAEQRAFLAKESSKLFAFKEKRKRKTEDISVPYESQAWAAEECRNMLDEIAEGDMEELEQKFCFILQKCIREISAKGDDVADAYTRACEELFRKDVEVPVRLVIDYLNLFVDKFNPLHVEALLDSTEDYLYEKELPEMEGFRTLCAKLRYNIEEMLPKEEKFGIQFVETTQDLLKQIVEWYQKELGNNERVKEELAYLNCAYGVANEKIFLTAKSEEADSNYDFSWSDYSYVGILKETNQVIEFWCVREEKVGRLVIPYLPWELEQYRDMITEAVAFFRNKTERRQFFEVLEKNTGSNVYRLRKKAHKELYATLPATYHFSSREIENNPLAETLNKMIELCEAEAYKCGYGNTHIDYPATPEEIDNWEKEHDFTLPADYRYFLNFANGVRLFEEGMRIFGLH